MKVRIKRSGSIFIGVTIFLGIASANTANNLLYILVSAMLSTMLVSGILSIFNIRKLRVRLIPPPEVYAGRPARFRFFVKKEGKLPSFLIKVSSKESSHFLPMVDSEWTAGEISLTFPKRGIVERISLTLSSEFPIGTFERTIEVEERVDVVVFPSPERTPLFVHPQERRGGDVNHALSIEKGFDEVKEIRDYMMDPIKLIHWKATARRGKLMVREMTSEKSSPVIIDLEKIEGDMEKKLSKATYLVNELMKEGYPVGLKLKDRIIPPERGEKHRLSLLRELALY